MLRAPAGSRPAVPSFDLGVALGDRRITFHPRQWGWPIWRATRLHSRAGTALIEALCARSGAGPNGGACRERRCAPLKLHHRHGPSRRRWPRDHSAPALNEWRRIWHRTLAAAHLPQRRFVRPRPNPVAKARVCRVQVRRDPCFRSGRRRARQLCDHPYRCLRRHRHVVELLFRRTRDGCPAPLTLQLFDSR